LIAPFPAFLRAIDLVYGLSFSEAKNYVHTSVKARLIDELDEKYNNGRAIVDLTLYVINFSLSCDYFSVFYCSFFVVFLYCVEVKLSVIYWLKNQVNG